MTPCLGRLTCSRVSWSQCSPAAAIRRGQIRYNKRIHTLVVNASSGHSSILSSLRNGCAGGFLSVCLCSALIISPAEAHIQTSELMTPQPSTSGSTYEDSWDTNRRRVVRGENRQPPSSSQQAAAALQCIEEAHLALANEEFEKALDSYTRVVQQFPDLAFTEYARIGRALMLYQVGQTSEAILELQDVEVALRGYSEVHAALAAILYAERPNRGLQAEQEWELAAAFDSRYTDLAWVQQQKHWPPRALQALDRFLRLA